MSEGEDSERVQKVQEDESEQFDQNPFDNNDLGGEAEEARE